MASSTASSANTDTVDGGPSSSSSSSLDPAVLQKKLAKIDQRILMEEAGLAAIQDKLIQLGMSHGASSTRHTDKVQDLEKANDKASRHIEEYRMKKRKYELALRTLEDQARQDSLRSRKEIKDTKSGSLNIVGEKEKATKMLSLRRTKNGENGSARSRDSRGSKDDSPAPPGDNTALLRVLPSEVSLSSLESDSQESQKRQRRLDEITEIVSEKLEPLAEDMHDLKGKLDQIFKLLEDSKVEIIEERKGNNAIFDDIIRRCGYVEEQIHDLIELHQKETAETKTYLVDTQDKMNYVFHERVRDMKDEITGLVTRIAKIEHRQKEDESLARAEAGKSVFGEMAFKMVDCLLLFGQLVIAVVGAISHFFQMTAENSTRLVVFLVAVIAVLVVFQFREDLPFHAEITHFADSALCRLQISLPTWLLKITGQSPIPSDESTRLTAE